MSTYRPFDFATSKYIAGSLKVCLLIYDHLKQIAVSRSEHVLYAMLET